MRTISPRRIFSILGIVVLGCFPLYTMLINNLHLLVFWFVGLLVLGCYTTLQARSFRAAPEAGLWVGCLSAALVVGILVYTSIINPLHELASTHITTPEQAGAYGWLPLFYVFLVIACCGLWGATVGVALLCSSVGGLVGMMFSRLNRRA